MVLIFCVEFRELSHLTRDLSLAEKKINVGASCANTRNDIYFTQNGQSCHFVGVKWAIQIQMQAVYTVAICFYLFYNAMNIRIHRYV